MLSCGGFLLISRAITSAPLLPNFVACICMMEAWMGTCWFALHLRAGPPGGLPGATCLIYCESRGEAAVRGCEHLSGGGEGDSSTPRGQRPDACWEIDMLLHFWSVELHPISAQLPYFNSSGFFGWWPAQGSTPFHRRGRRSLTEKTVSSFSLISYSELKAKTS